MNQQVTHRPTAGDINTALKDEIQRWREDQKFALRDTLSTHGKQLSEIPNAFAAATCFQFAVNATEKIFPLSAGAALIKRAAIPIWLISEASSCYKDLYVDDLNPKEVAAEYRDEVKRLAGRFAGKSNCVIPWELVHQGNFGGRPAKQRTMQILANIDKYDVVHENGLPIIGTPTSIGWSRAQPNLSYGQFLHNLTHGLTSSLLAELEQVEEKLWQQRYGQP